MLGRCLQEGFSCNAQDWANLHHCFSFINMELPLFHSINGFSLPFLCSWDQISPSLLYSENKIPTNSPNEMHCVPLKRCYISSLPCALIRHVENFHLFPSFPLSTYRDNASRVSSNSSVLMIIEISGFSAQPCLVICY